MCQTALTGRRHSVPAASGEERPVLTWRALKHRTLKPASGAHRPVRCRFAYLSAHESGGHRTRPVPHKERPVTPRAAHKSRAWTFSWGVFSFFSLGSARSQGRACALSHRAAAAVVSPKISGALEIPPRARSAQGALPFLLLAQSFSPCDAVRVWVSS